MTDIQKLVVKFVQNHPSRSSKEIHKGVDEAVGYSTLKRILTDLIAQGVVVSTGKLKGTKYLISDDYGLHFDVDVRSYFEQEQDEREISDVFEFSMLTERLSCSKIFSASEINTFDALHHQFLSNVSKLSVQLYDKEMERLAIDLSWKSSQIEGNTYTLLETERLLREKQTAAGKPKDDAVMLLNHKDALNFIIGHKDYLFPLNIRGIEDIHSILMKELGVSKNIRQGRVGITGTNYVPLDNEYQIRDAMEMMCKLVNAKSDPLEKSFLTLILLSYIQPFEDGNKRTARIVANAILIASGYCPLSFRTVDSIYYKEAMLIFYELNNISAFKKIFIEQYEFAVKTYF